MILCPLSISYQKPNAFLLYKTCIFELKSNFLFTVTKKMRIQFTFLSKEKLSNCPEQDIPYNFLLVSFFFFFFCSHQKKIIVNKVISFLKQCSQLASIHGIIFSCMQYLYILRKTTKKFNFKLLCLYCLYYILYDIQLTIFKESRKLKTLFSIMKNLNHY